jgi:uncharacterized membrane protein YgcG
MLGELIGISAHPLMADVPLVMLPLCTVLAVLLTLRPEWADRYGIPFVVLTGISFAGTVLAAQTSPRLEDLLNQHRTATGEHTSWAEIELASAVFFALAVAFVVVARRTNRVPVNGADMTLARAMPILAALLSASAVICTAAVIDTTHTESTVSREGVGQQGLNGDWSDPSRARFGGPSDGRKGE